MSEMYRVPVDMEVTNEQLRFKVSDYKVSDVQTYIYRLDALRSLTGETMIRRIISGKRSFLSEPVCRRCNS